LELGSFFLDVFFTGRRHLERRIQVLSWERGIRGENRKRRRGFRGGFGKRERKKWMSSCFKM